MYRVRLDEAARQELRRRAHAAGVKPRTRDRLEMIRLADTGWSVPKIAQHFGLSEKCVRSWIKAFLTGGFDALPDRPHVGKPSQLSPELVRAMRAPLRQGERTWTAQQIADWLAQEHGVRLGPDWLGRLLRRTRFSYQRTSRTLRHKQDAQEVAAKTATMQTLEKGVMPD